MQRILSAYVFGVLASASASAGMNVDIPAASVERSADGIVTVRWQSTPRNAPIDVALLFPGTRERRLVSDDDRDGMYAVATPDAMKRPLVLLTSPAGETIVTAERMLPLEGGRNFRDLGGYQTADGRHVRWGKVFRSGTMTDLTDADYTLLSTMNIKVVCDFRTSEEREREPTMWRTSGTKPQYLTRDYSTSSSKLREAFGSPTLTAAQVRSAMIELYGEMPYEHAESYRTMFKSLAAGEAPLAFNCSAGKDRTGVAAALLLTMLGVPRETVLADYAMSERVVDYEAKYAKQAKQQSKPGPWDFIMRLPAEVRAPLLRSEPEYIRAALTKIEEKEGSIDAYFERVLKISQDQQRAIRELLLEPNAIERSALAR